MEYGWLRSLKYTRYILKVTAKIVIITFDGNENRGVPLYHGMVT
jgi:hypothetical protein